MSGIGDRGTEFGGNNDFVPPELDHCLANGLLSLAVIGSRIKIVDVPSTVSARRDGTATAAVARVAALIKSRRFIMRPPRLSALFNHLWIIPVILSIQNQQEFLKGMGRKGMSSEPNVIVHSGSGDRFSLLTLLFYHNNDTSYL